MSLVDSGRGCAARPVNLMLGPISRYRRIYNMARNAIAFALIFLIASADCLAQQKHQCLPLSVPSIFVPEDPVTSDGLRSEEFHRLLIESLTKAGFKLKINPAEADTILTTTIGAQIVLDGDGSTPDLAIYDFRLTSRQTGLFRKWIINVPVHDTGSREDRQAIQRLIGKLKKDAAIVSGLSRHACRPNTG